MDIHQQLEASQNRRMAAEARYLDRLDAREEEAEALVGELVRGGKTVYYINARGGKVREGKRLELISFLIRNDYV